MRESEAVVSYLKSLASRSVPSHSELETLARIAGWEEAMRWCEEVEISGGGGVMLPPARLDCPGYGVSLPPWGCVENQVSPFCLEGGPCEACEEAVGLVIKGKDFYCGNHRVPMTTGLCEAARLEAERRSNSWPEGLGWLKVCLDCPVKASENTTAPPAPARRKRRRQVYDPKTMTRAVARDLGLI